MLDLFSDIFAYRENFGTRMDPRGKLVLSLVALFCTILSTRMILPLGILFICLAGMLALRTPPKLLLVRLTAPLGVAGVLILLQSFLFGQTEMVTVSILGIKLKILQEGVWRGLLLGSKVLGAVSIMLLFSLVTPAHRIFHALLWFRLPRGWVEIAMLMYRYIFSLLDDTADVAAAQRLRLGYNGIRRSLSSIGRLAGAVLIRSLDQAAATHEAMTLRGYRGAIPFGPLPVISRKDLWTTAIGSAVISTACLLLERGFI